MRFKSLAAATGAAFAAVLTLSADAAEISGAGATFPDPIYAKWSEAYRRETGTGLAYQSIGSAGGIKQIVAKTVSFGASDKPLDQSELDANGLIQFPMIMGGIIPVINVEGIKPGDIVLDGSTLAKIFLGEITQWDDPAIKALNEKIALPALEITVVHRSDGSGTTYNFTKSRRSGSRRQSNGRSASAPNAMTASPRAWRAPRAPSAMSNMPQPRSTSSPTPP